MTHTLASPTRQGCVGVKLGSVAPGYEKGSVEESAGVVDEWLLRFFYELSKSKTPVPYDRHVSIHKDGYPSL